MKPTQNRYGVFISYSREDSEYISPVVSLVRALRKDLVFQDTINLKPGIKWKPQLEKALDEASIIILFWCKHSAKSKYVKKEYERGINDNKEILPILLDNTKLNKKLAEYQGIDFRINVSHLNHPPPKKVAVPNKVSLFLILLSISALIFYFTAPQSLIKSFPTSDFLSSIIKYIVPIIGFLGALISTGLVFIPMTKDDSQSHKYIHTTDLANKIRDRLNEKLPPHINS